MPDFRLQIFHAVATHLSFTKAATLLDITQPAVSKNIGELEQSFQAKLFERKGNKVKLTAAGEILWDYTQKLVVFYENMFFDVAFAPKQIEGQLRINSTCSLGQYVLPDLVARFLKIFPLVSLSIQHKPDDWQLLQKNVFDFHLTHETAIPNQLSSLTILDDPLVWVVYRCEPFRMNFTLESTPLQALPIATLASMKDLIGTLVPTATRSIQYFEHAETIKHLIRYMPWVALLPKHCLTAQELRDDFQIIETHEDWNRRYCKLVYNSDTLGEIGKAFLSYIQNYHKQFLVFSGMSLHNVDV